MKLARNGRFFLLLLLSLVIIGCDREDSQKLDKVVVRLKWLHQAQFAGFYTADQMGIYREENLDVKLNPGGVDVPAIQMVIGGSEQFGVTAAEQLIFAREKGAPVVAIAVIYRVSPFVLFSLKGSGISGLQDFVGKRIGVKLGGNEELTYRAMMRNAGISFDKVKEIPVKFDMSPLFTKQVDVWPGYVIHEPIVAEEKGYPVNIIWPNDYGVSFYADALFTTEEMIQDNPDIVARFVKATLRGWEYAIQNPEEAVQYTLLYDENLNHAHELKMMNTSIELVKPDEKPVGWMTKEKWTEMQELLLKQNLLTDPIDINKVFTSKYFVIPQQTNK